MTTHTWTCDAGDYAVHIEGEGPALLLIHGIGPGTSMHANFGAAMPVLTARRTVYGIDLTGFGASMRPAAQARFDFAAWVSQARDAMSRIAGPNVQVWGQSLGAAIALSASAANARVSRIVGTGAGGGVRLSTRRWRGSGPRLSQAPSCVKP